MRKALSFIIFVSLFFPLSIFSQSVKKSPPPQEVSSGETVIPNNSRWDIENNRLTQNDPADVKWEVAGKKAAFIPVDGAALTKVTIKKFDEIIPVNFLPLRYLKKAIPQRDMIQSRVIAVQTRNGHYAKLEVIRKNLDSLKVRWHFYRKAE